MSETRYNDKGEDLAEKIILDYTSGKDWDSIKDMDWTTAEVLDVFSKPMLELQAVTKERDRLAEQLKDRYSKIRFKLPESNELITPTENQLNEAIDNITSQPTVEERLETITKERDDLKELKGSRIKELKQMHTDYFIISDQMEDVTKQLQESKQEVDRLKEELNKANDFVSKLLNK